MVDGHQNDGGRKYSTYLDIFVAKLRHFASVNYKGHNKTVLKNTTLDLYDDFSFIALSQSREGSCTIF